MKWWNEEMMSRIEGNWTELKRRHMSMVDVKENEPATGRRPYKATRFGTEPIFIIILIRIDVGRWHHPPPSDKNGVAAAECFKRRQMIIHQIEQYLCAIILPRLTRTPICLKELWLIVIHHYTCTYWARSREIDTGFWIESNVRRLL